MRIYATNKQVLIMCCVVNVIYLYILFDKSQFYRA